MTFIPDGDDDGGLTVTPSMAEVEAALADVPDEITWDWAAPRLVPLFERGYGEGINGDPMVNSLSHIGIGIGYGIDFGPVFGRVTRSMARRWEASIEQIERAAFAHLAEVVAGVGPADVQTVVDRGHLFHALNKPMGWASSVVLAHPSELERIFGTRRAILTVPSRNALLVFAPATPLHAIEDVTFTVSSIDPHPMAFEPFRLEDGTVRWDGLADDEAFDIG